MQVDTTAKPEQFQPCKNKQLFLSQKRRICDSQLSHTVPVGYTFLVFIIINASEMVLKFNELRIMLVETTHPTQVE